MTELGESEEDAALEVQIGNIDYYMAPPTPADCALRAPYNIFEEPLKQVPVLRIFGITRSEQRICLHVHQVWPYLYVAYDGPQSIEAVRMFGYQLGLSLNHALNVSLKNSSGSLFVAAVVPVKGVPFYGFCAGYRPLLKVFLANPDILGRASNLLTSGAVMGRRHEVFESHLAYIMQFLVDYNLYGVDWARLDKVLYRSPLPEDAVNTGHPQFISDSTVSAMHRWVPQGVPSYLVNPTPPDRGCRCELEADAVAADVANRRQVHERHIHHVFQEGKLDAHFGRLIHSLDSIWIDENRRRAQLGLDPLQPRNSQALPDTSQLPSCEPATQARARGLQWSNHWRLHSLLQSALADDRRKHRLQLGNNQNDTMADMLDQYSSLASNGDTTEEFDTDAFGVGAAWLSAWPTCREVDVGEIPLIPLIPGDDLGNRWFYTQLASSPLPAQHVDTAADPGKLFEVTPPKSILETHQVTPLAPAIWPVIDVELINCIEADTRLVGAHTGDTGNESTDSSEPPRVCCSPPVASASETDDLEDFNDSWLEGELPSAEEEYGVNYHPPVCKILLSSRSPRKAVSIPQLDGAADNNEGDITTSNRRGKRSASSRCEASKLGEPYRKGRRVVAPLRLAYSASSIVDPPKVDKRHRRHRVDPALVLRRTADCPAKGASRHDTESATRIPERRVAASCHSTTRIKHVQPGSRFKRRQSDVYVDIPHMEGQFLASFVKGGRNSQLTIASNSTDWDCKGDVLDVGWSSLGPDLNCSILQQDDHSIAYAFKPVPPSIDRLVSTLSAYNLTEAVTPVAAFSDDQDIPTRVKVYSGHRIWLSSRSAHSLPIFDPAYEYSRSCGSLGDEYSRSVHNDRRQDMWGKGAIARLNNSVAMAMDLCQQWHEGWWRYSQPPPKVGVLQICAEAITAMPMQRRQRDQSDLKWSSVLGTLSTYPGATSQSAAAVAVVGAAVSNFSMPPKASMPTSKRLQTYRSAKVPMSLMSLEILTCCREDAHADPNLDEILCMSASFARHTSQGGKRHVKHRDIVWTCGISAESTARMGLPSQIGRHHFADELSMILALVEWTHENDPDILCGYEVQQGSWGYVIERAEVAYDTHLCSKLSRIIQGPPRKHQSQRFGREKDSWGHRKGAAITIVGRHVLNVWRLMRGELSLTSYTFEKIVKEVLGEQQPHYPPHQLAAWYSSGPAIARIRTLQHVLYRARTALRILDRTGIVARTAEFASVIGIDFSSVLTRGSQLRVESLMARIAHPELYVLASPTRAQVAQQRAAECLPLVLEPQSRYYTDPVLVLDFQSLYPSIMIAYNYCFSTCLGSLEQTDDDATSSDTGTSRRLGFTSVHVPAGMLNALKDNLTVSPNGVLFVKPAVRRGLLGRMLNELLESRVMLKDAMKQWGGSDEALFKKLDAWQLGLKLIANVTYGYAGASFSGRMPCVELADAIVQSGRETLESAIRLIHSRHATWGVRVVYGDTDSVFVHLPGKSRQSAFRIGQEIADAVTKMNPAPVKLKFEKVYQPCILLTKKRYTGWMYTTAEQREPLLDVKGMELVRCDGCVATQRILEGTLDNLFRTNDLSLVKSYVTTEITRLLRGELPLQEYIIAKEVRMGSYSGRTLPAHAKVAADDMQNDPRAEPQHGERVPYVVISSGRNARLVDQVIRPHQLLKRPELRINSQYYVDKQVVPALDRVLSLVGVDVRAWVNDMPRRLRGSIYDAAIDAHSDSDSDSEGEASHDPAAGSCQAALPQASKRAALRTLDHFYNKRDCFLCGQAISHVPPSPGSSRPIDLNTARACDDCRAHKSDMLANVGAIQREAGQALKVVFDQCAACVGGPRADALLAAQACDCLDCPTMFQRSVLSRRYAAWHRASQALEEDGRS